MTHRHGFRVSRVAGVWCFVGLAAVAWAADCNLNGISDVQDIADGTIEDCNGDLVPDECQGTPTPYELETPLPGEIKANAIAFGRVDADAHADLIVLTTEGGESRLDVWTSDASGRLSRADAIKLSDAPRKMAVGDFNGDRLDDIVVYGSFGARYVENTAGDSEHFFREAMLVTTPESPQWIVTGDVEGDGFVDWVASTRRTGELAFVPGTAGGPGEPVATPIKEGVTFTALGEFTGDERLDVAAVSTVSDDVTIYASLGNGGFVEHTAFPIGPTAIKTLRPVDWDRDGALDLALVTFDRAEVYRGDGAGNFRSSGAVPLERATGADVFDVDHDGDPDIAITSGGSRRLSFLRNGNASTIESLVDSGLSSDAAFTSPASADLNGDGVPEVAVLGRGVSLATSSGNAAPVTPLEFDPTHYPIELAHWGETGDLDGDGDLDVVAAIRPPALQVYRNDGAGNLRPIESYSVDSVHFFQIVDIDFDGDLDLLVPEASSVFLNDGSGVFELERRVFSGRIVRVLDVDRDGHVDIASAAPGLGVRYGPELEYSEIASFGARELALVADDLLGSELADLATIRGSTVFVFEQTEARRFVVRHQVPVSGATHLASADFDRDGDVDLISSDVESGDLTLLWNEGALEWIVELVPHRIPGVFGIRPFEANGDGRTDLVAASIGDDLVRVFLGGVNGGFQPPVRIPVPGEPRWAGPGDMDGDGRSDIVVANRRGSAVSVFLNRTRNVHVSHRTEICTELDFSSISIPVHGSSTIERVTKFIAPVRSGDAALLPVAFQNVWRFDLHLEFLKETFPDRFGALTPGEYEGLVSRRATREYFIGNVYQIRTDVGRSYGFHVIAGYDADPRELPRREEIADLYARLAPLLPLGPLVYFPADAATRENAEGWGEVEFPIHFAEINSGVEFIPYTTGVTFGRVRVLDAAEFVAANDAGEFSFQEILVLERSPRDIEGVVGGVITAEAQGELSHLAIRTARRGTPNAFVRGAAQAFAELDGELIRLEVTEDGYSIDRASVDEAERWWEENRRKLSTDPNLDEEYESLDSLAEIAIQAATGVAESRFGGKAANFAKLQTALTGDFEHYRARGFAIPMRHYLDFMRENRRPSFIDETRDVSYAEFVAELLVDDRFRTDPAYRFSALRVLREEMVENGVVDPAFVRRVALKVATEFGATEAAVRFRSSSNVEDALEFSGAGLYASTSGCAADDLDADANGPSRCDASRRDERGIARALRVVWASLWNFRAFEEREFFSVDHDRVGMGILVSKAFQDERANGVALTGNPLDLLDGRYIVTAQVGERSVVSPEPGEIPERTLLEVTAGEVTNIERSAPSSLAAPGDPVLTDDQLRELGRLLAHLVETFPLELGEVDPARVLLDVEFKIDREGALAVKQVRPFLSNVEAPPSPTFSIAIPPGTELCGAFVVGRDPRAAYELKGRLRLRAGEFSLPTSQRTIQHDLVLSVELGQNRARGEPLGPGLFRLARVGTTGAPRFRFEYEQTLRFDDGRELALSLSGLEFALPREGVARRPLELSDERLSRSVLFDGVVAEAGEPPLALSFRSCSYDFLPLWLVQVTTDAADRFVFTERFEPKENIEETGLAELVEAEIQFRGHERQTVRDYWRLVYTAGRHNLGVRYWIVLEEPVTVSGIGGPIAFIDVSVPDELFPRGRVRYLGERFQLVREAAVRSSIRRELSVQASFVRGDATADGSVNLSDAIYLLGHLFGPEREPLCLKTADANDDAAVNISDALAIIQHLVGGVPMPPPSGCEPDPTPDRLDCRRYDCPRIP